MGQFSPSHLLGGLPNVGLSSALGIMILSQESNATIEALFDIDMLKPCFPQGIGEQTLLSLFYEGRNRSLETLMLTMENLN